MANAQSVNVCWQWGQFTSAQAGRVQKLANLRMDITTRRHVDARWGQSSYCSQLIGRVRHQPWLVSKRAEHEQRTPHLQLSLLGALRQLWSTDPAPGVPCIAGTAAAGMVGAPCVAGSSKVAGAAEMGVASGGCEIAGA